MSTSISAIRSALKRQEWLKSTYYLGIALRQMVGDQWKQPSSYDDIFNSSADPWRSSSAGEKIRFETTLSMLAAADRERFATAVEIGCAEGIFTEQIGRYCDSLLALDYSEVALDRARARLEHNSRVSFRRWDMRDEHLDGKYVLVVAMGVLTSLYRPADVRRVCRMIVGAIEPGGYLLFSDVRQSPVFERAWWGPMILRGGEQIRRLLSTAYGLEVKATADTASHVFALFHRPSTNRGPI